MKLLALLRRTPSQLDLRLNHRLLHLGSSDLEVDRQNKIFQAEVKRQSESVGRIEKIEVVYNGVPSACKMLLNKGISTPYNAAQHISEGLLQQSGLALVNQKDFWDMHRPLENDCEIEFLKFNDANPFHINKAFWRTCSFLMGSVIRSAFKSEVQVVLHSFPSPNILSGSFTYDAHLGLDNWQPTMDELRSLSANMVGLATQELPLERLSVSEEIALDIFSNNKYKLAQIPSIASHTPGGKITLYRAGKHIDISKGPLVGNTSFVGRCSITAVHKIETGNDILYRFQGVALPKGILLNHFAYHILEERSSRLNTNTKYVPPVPAQAQDVAVA